MTALMRARMWFTVLGPVRAWLGEQELDLGSPQQRALLAVLLVRAGRPAGLAEIVDAMWGPQPPPTAINAVHRGVGGLRRALQPGLASRDAGRWLVRSAGGYRLDVDADTADLVRYRWLVGRARTAAGDASAAGLFAEALELWQGPVAGGVGAAVRAHPLVVAVEREHLAVAREAADAALAADEAGRLLPAVALAADHAPLDEPLQARLVLLLAAASGPAAALEHYGHVRAALAQELGLDPGAELRAARDRVLRRPTQRAHAAEPAPAAAPRPAQLPADLPTFVGRRAELAEALASHPPREAAPGALVITVIGGMAGVGKTALAVHWAHQVAGRYPDGQLYVNLRGFDPVGPPVAPGDALHDMLTALGVSRDEIPAGLDARSALLRTRLAGRRVLMLLDNARDLAQVRPLLPGSVGCLVIVTSRSRLAGLLAVGGANLLTLDVLPAADARDFLSRRIGAQRVAREDAATKEIVERCAGLPLALAIVAARAVEHATVPLQAIAAELVDAEGGLEAFTGPEPAVDARAVISWSYRSLSPSAAALCRLLGAHPGPDVSAGAAGSLLGAPARAVLDELTGAHLLTERSPGRFEMHDLLHSYAAELFAATDPEPVRRAALLRLFDHYLHTAFRAVRLLAPAREPIALGDPAPGVTAEAIRDGEHARAWFGAEHAVLAAVADRAAAAGYDGHVSRLAWALDTVRNEVTGW
ncbi:AfsR/SARP family transcriptional regulator [Dactylosporangium darangshiense]